MNYVPAGAQIKALRSSDPFVVYSGPVGTGKTSTLGHKANTLCLQYPGARFAFLRQVKHTMAQTVLVTFERDVVDWRTIQNPDVTRPVRQSYRYHNGSEIVIGGLDKPENYLSGEYDGIYVFQGEETAEPDIDLLTTRLRNFVVPFQQLVMDVNPGPPNHWIKRRFEAKRARLLEGTLMDNGRFWDRKKGDWTKFGRAYLDTLLNLRGHLRDRMVYGKWAAPEGARFEGANRELMSYRAADLFPSGMPGHWRRWLAGDYGKSDPYCALWIASDEEGNYYVYQEDYEIGYEADQQAERVKMLSPVEEVYENYMVDPSFFQDGEYARGFGWHPNKGSAALQYEKVLNQVFTERGERKFGPLIPGRKNIREQHYITIDAMLRNGTLRIERNCTNLWNEIENAVYYTDPRFGVKDELINPPGKSPKPCPDHALETLGYGICRDDRVSEKEDDGRIDMGEVMTARAEMTREAIREEIQRMFGG